MSPEFIFFDLFCGAGGFSTGAKRARVQGQSIVKLAGCINHDPFAILSHSFNHKGTKHFTEDIRTFDVSKFKRLADMYRKKYPTAKICVWSSLECIEYSRAKGGKSRKADSRTLAVHLYRYIRAINPDYLFIENVMEFRKGCELVPKEVWVDKKGNRQPGSYPKDYHFANDQLDWYYGKKVDAGLTGWCELDKDGMKKTGTCLPVWHPNPNKIGEDYEDWRDHIRSMGYDYAWKQLNAADFGGHTTRKRYFAMFAKPHLPIIFPEPTHNKNGTDGLRKWNPVREVLDFSVRGDDILPEARILLGKKPLVETSMRRVFEGCVKHLANGDRSFLTKEFSSHNNTKLNLGQSVNIPAPTISCRQTSQLVNTELLSEQIGFTATYHGTGHNTHNITSPAATVTCKEGMSVYFIDKSYSGSMNHSSINSPAGAVMTKDHFSLVSAEKHQHYLLLIMQYGDKNCATKISKPCPTLIARMDKTAPYLIEVEEGKFAIKINRNDSPSVKNIKKLMAAYGICRIRMRMLLETELLMIQGFPPDYKLFGTSADRKKFIGNAVETNVPKKWLEALAKPFVDKRVDDIIFNVLKRA